MSRTRGSFCSFHTKDLLTATLSHSEGRLSNRLSTSAPPLAPALRGSRQVAIQYILSRKKEIVRETAAWEAQQAGDASTAAAAASAAHESRIAEFVAQQVSEKGT